MQYTTAMSQSISGKKLFYQDFKDTFVCNTQLVQGLGQIDTGCFIRISKILLYAIHNLLPV